MDVVLTIFFTIDYIMRWVAAHNRISYPFQLFPIIDLVTVVPVYIEVARGAGDDAQDLLFLRFVRVLRIARILRAFKIMNQKFSGNNTHTTRGSGRNGMDDCVKCATLHSHSPSPLGAPHHFSRWKAAAQGRAHNLHHCVHERRPGACGGKQVQVRAAPVTAVVLAVSGSCSTTVSGVLHNSVLTTDPILTFGDALYFIICTVDRKSVV